MMTSTTHPIRVDWLPSSAVGPGLVGLTFAPGKKAPPGIYGGAPSNRDLTLDLRRLREEYGVTTLACLLEDHEFVSLRIEDYFDVAAGVGLSVLRFPIPDAGIPRPGADTQAFVRSIDERFESGQRVVIHCRGGLGRAGTIGALWLRHRGRAAELALREVSDARKSSYCPETIEQKEFVRRLDVAKQPHTSMFTRPSPDHENP
jgi:protein-tyrosine phosphatase